MGKGLSTMREVVNRFTVCLRRIFAQTVGYLRLSVRTQDGATTVQKKLENTSASDVIKLSLVQPNVLTVPHVDTKYGWNQMQTRSSSTQVKVSRSLKQLNLSELTTTLNGDVSIVQID